MTIIELEKQLLMISKTEKKFKLGMNDLIKLKEYMNKVGEITNIFSNLKLNTLTLLGMMINTKNFLRLTIRNFPKI